MKIVAYRIRCRSWGLLVRLWQLFLICFTFMGRGFGRGAAIVLLRSRGGYLGPGEKFGFVMFLLWWLVESRLSVEG